MKLYGINPIIERLRIAPSSVKKIYIAQGLPGGSIQKRAQQHNIPCLMVPETKIQKIGRDKNTQGFIADVDDFSYTDYDEILSTAKGKHRSLIFLDGLNDPQNLGVIIRSLACLGRFVVIIPTHNSVSVTEAVLRVASGGENYVPICLVANLVKAIEKAKVAGYWIVGSVVKNAKQFLGEQTWPAHIGVVVGSEQKGIRDVTLAHLDETVSIPMYAETISFNAAQALTIMAYEITIQKRQKNKS